jgi:hypothetical protein
VEKVIEPVEAVEFEGGFFAISSPVRRFPSSTSSATSLIRVTGSHALHSDRKYPFVPKYLLNP